MRKRKNHKVAIIRNTKIEIDQLGVGRVRYTRCGIVVPSKFAKRKWSDIDCKNCLRTKA